MAKKGCWKCLTEKNRAMVWGSRPIFEEENRSRKKKEKEISKKGKDWGADLFLKA